VAPVVLIAKLCAPACIAESIISRKQKNSLIMTKQFDERKNEGILQFKSGMVAVSGKHWVKRRSRYKAKSLLIGYSIFWVDK
jgi:uncharacterized protein YcfL